MPARRYPEKWPTLRTDKADRRGFGILSRLTEEHTARFRGARGAEQTPPLAVLTKTVDLELRLFRLWLKVSAVWVGAVFWIALCFWLVLSSWSEDFVFWALIPPIAAILIGQVVLLVLKGIRSHH